MKLEGWEYFFSCNNLAYNSTAWFEQKQGLHVTSILDPSLHTPKITKSASRPVQVWCIELNERVKISDRRGTNSSPLAQHSHHGWQQQASSF
jgi:hypothetical protein